MAETQHTPGPWVAREGTSTGMEVVAKKPRGGDYVIARCGGKDRESNAHVMAAADEMLAALRAVRRGMVQWSIAEHAPEWNVIADAIAKAEGR